MDLQMKISANPKFNKSKKVTETFLRLRVKVGGKWRAYETLYNADKREIKKLQDVINEMEYYRERTEDFPFELRQRISTEIGNTKKRDVFVKAKILPPIEERDNSIEGVFKEYKELLAKRCDKGEITLDTRDKRYNVLNKFEEFVNLKLRNISDIRDIKQSHCFQFINYLLYDRTVAGKKRTVAHTTAQSEKKWISQIFDYLIRTDVLEKNPFAGVAVTSVKSDERLVTIPWGVLQEIEMKFQAYSYGDKCPKLKGWYIYWLLTRYLGARKNEALQLRWKDVDFEGMGGLGAINMPAPKTSKKTGKSFRRCPMMNGTENEFVDSELRQELKIEFDRQKPQPNDYVVQGIMNLHKSKRESVIWKNKNPSTQLEKFIIFFGIAPWPKLLQNIRVTRENELMKHSPWRPEAVHAIIGHSREAYQRSYENVTDDDYVKALQPEYEDLIEDEATGLRHSPSYSPKLTSTGEAYLAKIRELKPDTPYFT